MEDEDQQGADPPTSRPSRRSILVAVVVGLAALGVGGWMAFRLENDPGLPWLSSHGDSSWIRYPSPPSGRPNEIVRMETRFRKRFDLTVIPGSAELSTRFFRSGLVSVNGNRVALRDCEGNWKAPCSASIASLLRTGTNVVEATVAHDSALPSLWLKATGPGFDLGTDTSWEASLAGGTWKPAVLAQDAPPPPRKGLFATEISPFTALRERWAALLGFVAASTAVLLLADRAGRQSAAKSSSPDPARWPLPAAVAVSSLAWVALFSNNRVAFPITQGFDAPAHLEYVAYILDRHALPLADEGWSMFHPPLYYLVVALLLGLAGTSPVTPLGMALVRMLGLSFGIANVAATAAVLRRCVPGRPAAQVAGLLAAGFLPVMVYVHHFVTNEVLLACLSSVAVLLTLRALQDGRLLSHLLVGSVVGLALLTKFTALLLLPAVFGVLLVRAWTGSGEERRPRLVRWTASVAAMLLVCGWHYARVWARFGTPFVGGWENRPGLGWWMDPGSRTAEHFLRFGRALTAPLFAGYNGLLDGIYSTGWGDGLLSGQIPGTAWPPWWSPEAQAAGYLLGLLPTLLALVGLIVTTVRWLRSPRADDAVLLTLAFLTMAAITAMSLRVACVAQDKASYGLLALAPFAVFVARGVEAIGARWRWAAGVSLVGIGAIALNAVSTYWVDRSGKRTEMVGALSLIVEGDLDGGERVLRRAVARDPEDWPARITLARVLVESGRSLPDAERLLRPADPGPALAARHLAVSRLEYARRDPFAAARAAKEAIRLDSDDAEAWTALALALQASGSADEAITAWREVVRIEPQEAPAHEALIGLLRAAGMPAEASVHEAHLRARRR